MWGEAVASLGSRLTRGHGWERRVLLGVELVTEPDRGTALVVVAGDAATGSPSYIPQVRYERREVTQGLVNGYFDPLWESETRREWEIWFLLHHLGVATLTGELSRPIGLTRSGLVTTWAERVLLPNTMFGGRDPQWRRGDGTPPQVDVSVHRRVG